MSGNRTTSYRRRAAGTLVKVEGRQTGCSVLPVLLWGGA
jgi:uncharacterized protein RhaS with RHS repeats